MTANIQALIRNLDPSKVTPELRAMLSAHMRKTAHASERDNGRKPGGAPAVTLTAMGPKVMAYQAKQMQMKQQRFDAVLQFIGDGERSTREIFAHMNQKGLFQSMQNASGFLSEMSRTGQIEYDCVIRNGGKYALWRATKHDAKGEVRE